MGRAIFGLVLALAAAGCATVDVKPLATSAPPAERPAYAIGHRWIRSDGLWELTAATETSYRFTRGDGGAVMWMTRDLVPERTDLLHLSTASGSPGDRFTFDPPARLEWPLAVGKRGASKGRWAFDFEETHWLTNRAGQPYARTMRFRTSAAATLSWVVDAWEEVRVPAGRFEAYRVVYTLTADEPEVRKNAPPWTLRMWYAPAIRQFVAADGQHVGLLAFRLLTTDPQLGEPVQVALRDPPERSEAVEPRVTVTGRASAGRGVGRVAVSVNGEEAWRREEPATPAEVALEVPVTLRPGRNVIIVSVTDTGGQTQQEARTVFFDPGTRRAAVEGHRAAMLLARAEAGAADA
ncbi:MAG: hypothetical protein FJ027_13695, partial [Candidatus Rokubacteria bacterium]|nr:hypothetical protein [Candidatus Rokubacteria bacterium]